MRTRRPHFATQSQEHSNSWYDLFEDWELIEASFLQQYGIRLRKEDDMQWTEFTSLLSCINSDTPLGNIVSIRAENDQEKLKNFSPEQRRIRAEWRTKHMKVQKPVTEAQKADYNMAMEGFKQMFINMAK